MYRAGVEGILGIRRQGACLLVDPCIPPDWPGFEATVTIESTVYVIRVLHPSRRGRGISRMLLDDETVPHGEQGGVRVPLDGGQHQLVLTI